MKEEFINYLERNGIRFSMDGDVFTIGGETYELSYPSDGDLYFDRGFNFIGSQVSAKNYVYRFGNAFYYLPVGKESEVTLRRLKYLGEVMSEVPTNSFLGVHGPFELLNGSGNYRDWCAKAKFYGIKNLGICERNTLAGILKFQLACEAAGIKPILGETITIYNDEKDFKYEVKVFAMNESGWQSVLRMNREINVVEKGFIREKVFLSFIQDIIVILDPKSLPYEKVPIKLSKTAFYQLDSVIFDKEFADREFLTNTQKYIASDIPAICMCDAYYLDQEYWWVRKELNAIGGTSYNASRNQYFKCTEEWLDELRELFSDDDSLESVAYEAIVNLETVASQCNFKVETGVRHLPEYTMTESEEAEFDDNFDLFLGAITDGLQKLNLSDEEMDRYVSRIQVEIDTIQYGDVVDYFLILRDIVRHCESEGILIGFGRGSAAGSLVAFLLGITKVNPFDYDLLFERFLNKGRIKSSLPDIDSDFPQCKRSDVKQYMENRYGMNQVCSVGTYATFQVKAALKDLCKNKGISFQDVRKLASKLSMEKQSVENFFKIACQDRSVSAFVNEHPEILDTMDLIYGQPKNKSIHACAMMIYPSDKTLFEWGPVSEQKGLLVSEWEGEELDRAGFLKEDILGIQQLDKLADILSFIEKNFKGKTISLYDVPKNDEKVFEYFKNGWNSDIFHFGAVGLTGYCRQLKPDNITELINCIGLYRPGVMESNFHNEYILRKRGERFSESRVGAEEILAETQNVMIWQEQTMRMFQKLGGFDLTEADTARRAIGKKDIRKLLPFKDRFITHYMENFGVDRDYAEDTWSEIEHMSSYQFNKCVSGRMVMLRGYRATKYKLTVEEMYKIMHSKEYAEEVNQVELRRIYLDKGYGFGLSLNENGVLETNRIKDIRYQGVRRTYKVTVEEGASISVTENHKFPTDKGELMLKDMKVGDLIPVSVSYRVEDPMYIFTDKSLKTEFKRIVSIEFDREESVYDIEMEHPYHTFAIDNGIVTCNSHAVCYALTGYTCQWLKVHYPLEYWAVTFSYAKDEDYPLYLSEIKNMDVVSIQPPDINESIDKIKMDIGKGKFYWPLSSVKQAGEKAVTEILAERSTNGQYFSLSDFIDRHNFKGSAVNKSVVENLILAGAFDETERIPKPKDRLKLIEAYRDIKKVKLTDKDIFHENSKIEFDWWYTLQQKVLCGFAFFDYEAIYSQYAEMFDDAITSGFKSLESLEEGLFSKKEIVVVGGWVYDAAVKQSKKGMYCRLKLEQNYKFIDVLVWNEQYEDFEELLSECKGKILFLSGNLVWSDHDTSYSLHSSSLTKMILLT